MYIVFINQHQFRASHNLDNNDFNHILLHWNLIIEPFDTYLLTYLLNPLHAEVHIKPIGYCNWIFYRMGLLAPCLGLPLYPGLAPAGYPKRGNPGGDVW